MVDGKEMDAENYIKYLDTKPKTTVEKEYNTLDGTGNIIESLETTTGGWLTILMIAENVDLEWIKKDGKDFKSRYGLFEFSAWSKKDGFVTL